MAVTVEGVIGHNLRAARTAAGLTQEECAFRAGVDRARLSLYECGRQAPRALTLMKLARACSVTPNDLFVGIDWEPPRVAARGRLRLGGEA